MTAIKRLNFGHSCIAELPLQRFRMFYTFGRPENDPDEWKKYESGWARACIHITFQNGNGLAVT